MRVDVVLALPNQQIVVELELAESATVGDALTLAQQDPAFAGFSLSTFPVGVWGERCELDREVVEGDRVELYRPLEIEAKERRRQHAAQQKLENS